MARALIGPKLYKKAETLSAEIQDQAREAGVLVRSKKIAKYYGDVFEIDWSEGLTPKQVGASLTEMSVSESL